MIDNFIIIIYLILILYIGYTCRRLGGFREFAVSHGHYGWLVICCTLSASFIGGGFSTGNAAKVFSDGIAYPVALLGFSLQIILVALFIAPRIKSFPEAVSVGEVIKDIIPSSYIEDEPDEFFHIMKRSYSDALKINTDLNGMADPAKIAITLFIARSKSV